MPMTVLEALAVGTPVLAHAIGGLNCVLSGNRGGELVDDHTPAGYTAGLQRLLARDRKQLAAEGLATLEKSYSAQANAAAVADLYRHCVN
jgi:glycosyltransferase involved in cell wall biosynthesis